MSPNVNIINGSSAPPVAAAATVCSPFDTDSCAFSTMESDNVNMNASTCTTTRVNPSSFLRIKLDTGHEVNLPFSQSVALLATAPLLLFFCFRSRRASRMALVLSYGLCLATCTPGNLLPDGLDFRAKAKLAYALFHLPLPLVLHCFGVARLRESTLVVASLPWVCTLLLLYSTGTIPFLAFLGPFFWLIAKRLFRECSTNKPPVQSYYCPTQHYMLPSSTTAESPPANSNSSLVRYCSQRQGNLLPENTTNTGRFFRDYEEDHNREVAKKTTSSWSEEQPYGPRRILEAGHKKDSNPDDTGGGPRPTGDGLGEIARISQDTGEEEIVFEDVADHKANHNSNWRKILPSLFSINTILPEKPGEEDGVPELLFSPTSMGSSPTGSSAKEEEDEKAYHSQDIGRRDSLHSLLSKNASLRQLPNNDDVPPLNITTNPSREMQDQKECNQDNDHTETLQSVFSSFPSLLQLPKATTSETTRNSVAPLLKTIVATPPFSGHTQSMFHPERPLLGMQGQNPQLLLQLTFVFAGQDPASKVLRLTDFPHNPQSGMPTSESCKQEATLIVPSQQSDDDATEEESVSLASANPEHPISLSPSRGSKEASPATGQQEEDTKEEGYGKPITDMPTSKFSHRCKEDAALVPSQQDDDATEEESVSAASDPLANLEHPTSLSPSRGSKGASLATSQHDEDTKEEGCGSTITDMPSSEDSHSCQGEASLASTQQDDDTTEEEFYSVASDPLANPEHPTSLSPLQGSKEASLATSQHDEDTKEEECGSLIDDPLPRWGWTEGSLAPNQQDDDSTEEEFYSVASDPLVNPEHPTSLSPPHGSEEASLATSHQDEDAKEEGCGSPTTDMPTSESSHSCQEEASLASNQQDDGAMEEECVSLASDPSANLEHPTSLSPPRGSKEASLATSQQDEDTKEEGCGSLISDTLVRQGGSEASVAPNQHDAKTKEKERLLNLISELAFVTS